MTQKIVINTCYGGYSLSYAAVKRLRELGHQEAILHPLYDDDPQEWFDRWQAAGGKDYENWGFENVQDVKEYLAKNTPDKSFFWFHVSENDRAHPALVQTVEELGKAANVRVSSLKVVEIPDDVVWEIEEYDGNEWVSEVHRTWS